jgi:hypothetical protein
MVTAQPGVKPEHGKNQRPFLVKQDCIPRTSERSIASVWFEYLRFCVDFWAVHRPQAPMSTSKGRSRKVRGRVGRPFGFRLIDPGVRLSRIPLFPKVMARTSARFPRAQPINVLWTLLVAYLLFGGVIFPQPAIK